MSLLDKTILQFERVLKAVPTLRRLSSKVRHRFCVDLALVGLDLRTGCLIDSFAPKDPVREFSHILEGLRQDSSTSDIAARIIHIFEPDSQQSFFLSVNGIQNRIVSLCENPSSVGLPYSPRFIGLIPRSDFEVISGIPDGVREVLKQLCELQAGIAADGPPVSYSLPNSLSLSVTVPLAAIILDYEIAYTPTLRSESTTFGHLFLSGVPVSTYECLLHSEPGSENSTSAGGPPISVMKFSCPSALEATDPEFFSPAAMSRRLTTGMVSRLEKAKIPGFVTVRHEVTVFERLAI